MIRGICDTPDRLAARVFLRVAGAAGHCPCCSFYRGALFGAALVALAALAAFALL